MKTVFEFFHLCWIALRVKWYFLCEERRVRSSFYRNQQFSAHDRALKKAYRFCNPYRMNKIFLQKMGCSEVDTYGETPLTTLFAIAKACGITAEDHVVELGCGRGRGTFFLRDIIGCRATGIDWNQEFIDKAQQVCKNSSQFICSDMLCTDLSFATAIYLFGTCLSDSVIEELSSRLSRLPPSTKIITVSFALSDYSDQFTTLKEFSGRFPWGDGTIFLQRKI